MLRFSDLSIYISNSRYAWNRIRKCPEFILEMYESTAHNWTYREIRAGSWLRSSLKWRRRLGVSRRSINMVNQSYKFPCLSSNKSDMTSMVQSKPYCHGRFLPSAGSEIPAECKYNRLCLSNDRKYCSSPLRIHWSCFGMAHLLICLWNYIHSNAILFQVLLEQSREKIEASLQL